MLELLGNIFFGDDSKKITITENHENRKIDVEQLYTIILDYINTTGHNKKFFLMYCNEKINIKELSEVYFSILEEVSARNKINKILNKDITIDKIAAFLGEEERSKVFMIDITDNLLQSISKDMGKTEHDVQRIIYKVCGAGLFWRFYGNALKQCVKHTHYGAHECIDVLEKFDNIFKSARETRGIIVGFNIDNIISHNMRILLHDRHDSKKGRIQKKNIGRVIRQSKKVITVYISRNPSDRQKWETYIECIEKGGSYLKKKYCVKKEVS